MSKELRLKYFIDLISNIREKAGSDAQALVQAQDKFQKALGDSENKLTRFEKVLMRVGGVHNKGLERQAQYFSQIALTAMRAQQAVEKLGRGLSATNKGLQAVTGAGAGAAGAFMVAKAASDKPVDYDTRLRDVSATAFAGKGIDALRAGYAQVGDLIKKTVQDTSGATRDSVLGAFKGLVGSGSFSYDESAQLLPSIMTTAVAGRADADDLVKASEKMKVNFGLNPAQIKLALAKLLRSGQEGGFEMKDSAQWIGPLAPMFKGYKGMAGVEAMVTMLQQVRSTAGTNDEAANNLRNFVQKMRSDGTVQDFKKQGIDLTAEMAAGAVKGQTPVDVYMAQLERVMAKQDPEGKARAAMRQADKSLSPEERQQRYEDVAEIYRNAGISKIINDLQEMGGYSGLAGTKEYGKKVLAAVRGETGGAVDVGYQFMTEGSGAKATDIANRKEIAASNALDAIAGPLNSLMDKTISLADEFPKTTAAAYGATVAITALAVASAAAAMLGGGGGVASKVGGWVGGAAGKLAALFGAAKIGGGAVAAGASTAGRVGAGFGALGKLLGPLGMILSFDALSDEDIARLHAYEAKKARNGGGSGVRGQGFDDPRRLDFLTLSAPGEAATQLAAGQSTKIEVGEGKLAVDVRVMDDRVSATSAVVRQVPLIRINPGDTNPGGFKR